MNLVGVAMSKKWFVVHTYSVFENKVRDALQQRIRQKTSLPGYIFVEMDMSEEAWHLVKDTPKVTGFIGNQRPQEVKAPQIDDLRKTIVEGAVKVKPRVSFEAGNQIRVIDGPFANFSGTVEEVNPDKQKLRVKVSIFGRATPVELDFASVEKLG